MGTDLRGRLADLAEEAPASLGTGRDLWRTGLRRHHRRRLAAGAAVAAAVVAVALTGGAGVLGGPRPERPLPADTPGSELHLPRTVSAPSPWAPGTGEAGPPGPLALLSMAPRNVADGLTGVRRTLGVFGVSAVDGSSVFLDLPGTRTNEETQLGSGTIALSPDGRKVAYVRFGSAAPRELNGAHVTGWDVYDAVSGKVVRLRVPDMAEIHGTDAFEIRFSGDSRYLLTNYSPTGSDGSRDDALVAWDVSTGRSTVAEGTGHYWLPEPASVPEGVAWSRDRYIFRFDPLTKERTALSLPREVVTSSFGPDGRALAYVGHRPAGPNQPVPWYLYAGQTWQGADRVHLDVEPKQILGWRSEHEVVVGNFRDTPRFVDVRTGASEPVTLHWDRNLMLSPAYAADLWRNPLVDGEKPPAVPDPRWWMRRLVWAVGILAAAVLLLAGVRSRRAGR